MTMIVLSLPDDLAARAISKGLLNSERMEALLTDELIRLDAFERAPLEGETRTQRSQIDSKSPASPAEEDAQIEREDLQSFAEPHAVPAEMAFVVKPKLLVELLKRLAPHSARVKKVDQYVQVEIVENVLVIVGENVQRAEIDVIGSGVGQFAVDRERFRRVLKTFSKRASLEFDARNGALSFAGVRIPFATVPKRRVVALR